MQTLARVNRTFRGKPDGLLVAYAPLAENLEKALAEYTEKDRTTKPVGRDVDEAAVETRRLVEQLDALCAGFGWRAKLKGSDPAVWFKTATALANWLRSPSTPGNQATSGSGTTPSPSGSVFASWWPSSPGGGRWPRAARRSPTSGRRCSSTSRSGSSWRSSTPPSGRPPESRCPRKSSDCSPTSWRPPR